MQTDAIIGDKDNYSLEHRILNTVLIFGIIVALLAALFNYILNLKLMSLVALISAVMLSCLYYFSLMKRYYYYSLKIATLSIFVVTPILWQFNGGITGGTPFYIIIFSSMIAVTFSGFNRIIFSGCLVGVSIFLLLLQYINSDWISGYSDKIVRLDTALGLIMALIITTSLYAAIIHQYKKEHAKAEALFTQIQKQKTELELSRFDRLNLIGEIAASLGHEVRNPLTTVRGFLQLYQKKQEYHRDFETLNLVIHELDRANSIISEFLSLAKNKHIDLKQTNLREILLKIVPLIQAVATKESKELFVELDGNFEILADDDEIKQLTLNLVKNAFDAVQKGGHVTIKIYQDDHSGVLMVKDNGSGIPPEVYEKIGTPFITTKIGGTGLGLPICLRIIERHQAKIQIDTHQCGTTFRIHFKLV